MTCWASLLSPPAEFLSSRLSALKRQTKGEHGYRWMRGGAGKAGQNDCPVDQGITGRDPGRRERQAVDPRVALWS